VTAHAAGGTARHAPRCPVCLRPDDGAQACPGCGWQMVGDLVLGPVTVQAESDLAAGLAAARRDYDLRAAVRAAGPAGERDEAFLRRLAGLARGGQDGPDQDGHVRRATAVVDAGEPPVPVTQAGVGFALARLVAGKTQSIALVEIGQDAIAVRTLVAGQHGVPVQQAGDTLAWTDLMPVLDLGRDLRYLVMAGGVGTRPAGFPEGEGAVHGGNGGPGPAELAGLAAEVVRPALVRLMAAADAAISVHRGRGEANSLPSVTPHRVDVILIRRTCRWPVLDAAFDCASAMLRPVARVVIRSDAGDLAEVVSDIARQAPLRHAYDLVLAGLGTHRGMPGASEVPVEIVSRELFAAGQAALPGHAPSANVPVVAAPRYAAATLALPVVVRHGADAHWRDPVALPDERPLLAMAAVSGGTSDPVNLRATLVGPGLIEFAAAPWLLPASAAPAWPALMGEVPTSLPSVGQPLSGVDLVLLVELGGDEQTVAARVRLARGVVDALRGEAESVRIAVLGYRDHFGKHNVDVIGIPDEEHEALIVGHGLRPAPEARAVFDRIDRWQAVPVGDYYAAPIEDALQLIAAAEEEWGWSRTGRHVLLLIGGRPPHPFMVFREGGETLPCPHKRVWEDSLGRLRMKQAVECLAVLDRRDPHGYAEYAWRQLSTEGFFYPEEVTAHQLARMVGPAPRTAAAELCLAMYGGGQANRDRAGR